VSLIRPARFALLPRLFSQDCQLCGARTTTPLCEACASELPAHPAGGCPQCGSLAARGLVCGACLAHPPAFDHTVAAYQYAFPLDRLVQSLKFNANLTLVDLFAGALAGAVRVSGHDGAPPPDLIVALPLAKRRLAERGFNQSALLASRVAKRLDIAYSARGLLKVRETAPQAGLSRAARLKNVRGAFASDGVPAGRHVALVDDVMTTGATLSEAAKTLKKSGAATVSAWVVARAGLVRHDGAPDDVAVPL
jgi:ComF family protein